MLRQLCLGASDILHSVMVRGVEGMAIFHHGPHADVATRPATPQPVRRHRMLRPPLEAGFGAELQRVRLGLDDKGPLRVSAHERRDTR